MLPTKRLSLALLMPASSFLCAGDASNVAYSKCVLTSWDSGEPKYQTPNANAPITMSTARKSPSFDSLDLDAGGDGCDFG